MESPTMNARFLRQSLRLDGVASGATGLLLLATAGPFAALAGLPGPGIARTVGGALVIYAAALFWNAGRATVNRGQALAAVVLNVLWVLGSAVLIVDGPLTLLGNLAVAAVAAAVLLFAVLQTVGLRRLRQA
jgi:hypothetical protein